MIGRNDPCWCGSGQKWKKCHFPQNEPPGSINKTNFDVLRKQYLKQYGIIIKTPEQIEGIRKACGIAVEILEATCAQAQEGITTDELNSFAHKLHREKGVIPAPLGYSEPPFPKSICTSINEVICHGIPDKTKLKKGDIINVDVTCIWNGFYGDCSKMVVIGSTTPERQLVVDTSYECLMESIKVLKPGALLSEIGDVIQSIADSRGCSVVNQFVGHGVGVAFHEEPQIPHHKNNIHIPLAEGMIFTIEPMINAGVREAIIDKNDQWTARTRDGKPSAQWEHTVLITRNGSEILTNWHK